MTDKEKMDEGYKGKHLQLMEWMEIFNVLVKIENTIEDITMEIKWVDTLHAPRLQSKNLKIN